MKARKLVGVAPRLLIASWLQWGHADEGAEMPPTLPRCPAGTCRAVFERAGEKVAKWAPRVKAIASCVDTSR